jgi:hypothetical protein
MSYTQTATAAKCFKRFGLEENCLKETDAAYRSGRSKNWIKVKTPKAPTAMRAIDGTF